MSDKYFKADDSASDLDKRAKRAWAELPKGPKRAIILAFIVSMVLWAFLSEWMLTNNWGKLDTDNWIGGLLLYPLLYWVLVFAGLWVYRGFKK